MGAVKGGADLMWRSVEDGNSEIKEVLKEGHNEKDVGSLDHVDVIRICRCTHLQMHASTGRKGLHQKARFARRVLPGWLTPLASRLSERCGDLSNKSKSKIWSATDQEGKKMSTLNPLP